MSNAALVLELFEKALQLNRANEEARYLETHPNGKTNPSVSDFTSCPRKVWYSLRGIEETNPPDVQSLANFFFGHAIEDAVAKLFELAGVQQQREISVVLGNTRGRIDFLLLIPDLKIIVELKSTKQKQVRFLPQGAHGHQLNGYLHAKALEGELWEGVLAYVVKDAVRGKQVLYAFDVPYSESAALKDLRINDAILAHAQNQDIPPTRPEGYLKSKFPCSYCPFMEECWK